MYSFHLICSANESSSHHSHLTGNDIEVLRGGMTAYQTLVSGEPDLKPKFPASEDIPAPWLLAWLIAVGTKRDDVRK